MNPLRYRRPTFVRPPFRDALHDAVLKQAGPEAVAALDRFLPLLDGGRTVADVLGAMVGHGCDPALTMAMLGVLDRLGSLAEAEAEATGAGLAGDDGPPGEGPSEAGLAAWFQARAGTEDAAAAARSAQATLANAHVVVVGLGRVGAALVEILASSGVGTLRGLRSGDGSAHEEALADSLARRVATLNPRTNYQELSSMNDGAASPDLWVDDEGAVPLIVYCPDVHHEEVGLALNRISLELGASLLPYRETAFDVEIGPLVIPGRTACLECYRLRRKAAEPMGMEPGDPLGQAPNPMLGFSAGAPLLAVEVIKFLTRAAFAASQGKLWRLGLFDGTASVHPVLKLPRCPACGVHRRSPPRRLWEA